ncbi:tetratricopeptide repeat protein [Chitinophaga sp. Mgbs1]|uniref:Tetratricopeptide repeat protein n=1 Tax=Chitinophaga solisilvae TaxID=1233460 RepID=A0A3S1D1N1_9BACT|nr:tetratricopeptide repeat protein [Chitinophaga solisilvae]
MRKQLLICFVVYACSLVPAEVAAQEQPSIGKSADVYFRREEYARAAGLYERLIKTRKGRRQAGMVKERLATSYRLYNQYDKAAYWYSQLLQDSANSATARLYYGDMLKSLGRYEEAKQQYRQYPDQQRVALRVAGCDSATVWQSLPANVILKNEQGINSRSNDWGATPYGKEIVFVSDSLRGDIWYVKGSRHRYYRNNAAFGKLYAAENGPSGIGYSKDFSSVINNYKYHVGPVCFTPNGDTAYVTVTDPARKIPYDKKEAPVYGTRRLKLLVFTKKQDKWQSPVAFPYNSDDYSLGHASLNSAGNILYYASDKPGGSGETDIWYSEKQGDNTWGTPQNCGAAINSPDDDAFPVLGPGDVLYYASKGWAGMGGYDVFAAEGSKGSWSAPVNLRPPFNTSGDDFYYTMHTAQQGFISSNRPGGRGGDDIYSFAAPDIIPGLQPVPVPLLRIPLIVDICVPAETCVYLYNKTRGIGWCYMVAPPSGKIEAKLEPDAEYEVRVHYRDRIERLAFDTRNYTGTAPISKTICPQPVRPEPAAVKPSVPAHKKHKRGHHKK